MEKTGKQKVLQLLESVDRFGITDEEIANKLAMSPSSARTRRCELEREGLVLPVGITQTKTGRRTFLWTSLISLKRD